MVDLLDVAIEPTSDAPQRREERGEQGEQTQSEDDRDRDVLVAGRRGDGRIRPVQLERAGRAAAVPESDGDVRLERLAVLSRAAFAEERADVGGRDAAEGVDELRAHLPGSDLGMVGGVDDAAVAAVQLGPESV